MRLVIVTPATIPARKHDMEAPQKSRLTVLILTFNEEAHIERCIRSVQSIASRVLVVDSGSTDDTLRIAEANGASVHFNNWVNYAEQMNFAIRIGEEDSEWLMRLDADEIVDPLTAPSFVNELSRQPPSVAGLAVRRRIVFMGKRIRFGGLEPSWQLRVFRAKRGLCEQRWMDEHILVDGHVVRSSMTIDDNNLKPITWWIDKHNTYASREAIDLLLSRHGRRAPIPAAPRDMDHTSPGAYLKRLIKEKIYLRLPGGLRAGIYFLYRYFIRGGILDGRRGFYFHFLQALWYRTLVDLKVAEVEVYMRQRHVDLATAVSEVTGIAIDTAGGTTGRRNSTSLRAFADYKG